jgi:hypothetical protein
MKQPWARTRATHPKSINVELEYAFEVEAIPSGELYLGIEQPQTFTIHLNGAPVETMMESGWWTDRSLRKVPISATLLRIGRNVLTLKCAYDENHPGLEIIYLLGNFGVRLPRPRNPRPRKPRNRGPELARIVTPPTQLKLGDWVPQGLAFYSGSVVYQQTIRPKLRRGQRLLVRVRNYRGVAVRVLVDGQLAGIAAWEPNEVDITSLVKGSAAQLQIEVLGHRRNSHGPFHHVEKWPNWTGPGQFITEGKQWVDHYQLVPCGLMKPPQLVTVVG